MYAKNIVYGILVCVLLNVIKYAKLENDEKLHNEERGKGNH